MDDSYRNEIAKLEALYASNPGGRVFVHLAEALRRAGEEERARSILEEGLARHPDSASGFVVLGRVLINLGDGAGAEAAFHQVLQLDGGNLVALRGLGDLALEGGRAEEAAGHYRELASRSPYNEEVQALLAQTEARAAAERSRGSERGGVATDEPEDWAHEGEEHKGASDAPVPDPASDDRDGPHHDSEADPAAGMDRVTETDRAIDPPDGFGEVELPAAAMSEQDPGEQSVAPGDTGEMSAPRMEYGIVDIDALPGDLAAYAGLAGEEVRDDGPDAPEPQALEDLQWDEPEQPEIAAMWEEAQAGPIPPTEDAGDLAADDVPPTLSVELPGGSVPDDRAMGPGGAPGERSLDSHDASVHDPFEGAAPHDQAQDDDLAGESLPEDAPPEVFALSSDDEGAFSASSAGADDLMSADAAPADELEGPADMPSPDEPADAADTFAEATSTGWDGMPEIAADADLPTSEPETTAASEPAWSLPAPMDGEDVDAGAGAGDDDVPATGDQLETETMADLYRSQGLLDRAADVYRSLLRRRPDDETLARKLSDTETALAASSGTDDETGEGWLRGTGTAWTEAAAPGASESPYAWSEAGDDAPAGAAPAGPTIREYLKHLISWQRPDQPPSDAAATSDPVHHEPQVDTAGAGADEPWRGAGEAGGAAEDDAAAASAADAPSPEAPADPWAAQDPWAGDAEPWTDTPSEPSEEPAPWAPDASRPEEAPPAGQQPADPVEDAFNEWFSGPGTGAPGAAAAGGDPGASAPVGDAAGEAPAGPDSTGTPGDDPAGSPAPATEDGGEEDEDLAMFRSWLQSLKK